MLDLPSKQWRAIKRGYSANFEVLRVTDKTVHRAQSSDLQKYFDSGTLGGGIWKWKHYCDIYDRHFCRFRGQEVHVLEIGVYRGESLKMWREYFGPKAHIYGVDIDKNCLAHEDNNIKIFIGDQADRRFWREFRRKVPTLDIVIDDGGHQPEQQIVSVEELLPFLRSNGIYVCEDVLGAFNQFASYIHGLGHKLNDLMSGGSFPSDRVVCSCTPFQSAVGSIHLYPFVIVVERNACQVIELEHLPARSNREESSAVWHGQV
jgi:hypothetical protein